MIVANKLGNALVRCSLRLFWKDCTVAALYFVSRGRDRMAFGTVNQWLSLSLLRFPRRREGHTPWAVKADSVPRSRKLRCSLPS